MASVLFVTWDGGGNVPPALLIAREVMRRGHKARVIGHAGQRLAVEAAGLAFEEYETARPWSSTRPLRGLHADLGYAGVFTDRGIGRDVVASLQREPADRVVVDGLLLGAMDGLQRAHAPYVVLVHTVRSVMVGKLGGGALGFIARSRGFRPRDLYAGAAAEIVVSPAVLDSGGESLRRTVVHVGAVLPTLPAPAPAPDTAPPLVVVSLSTTFVHGQRELLQKIVDALAELPVRAVVTTGPTIDPHDIRDAENTDVVAFVPHAELMARASVVVGHGGHATTMLALTLGVPMLVIPTNLAFDQPAIARLIADRGLGLTLRRTASVTQIRDAVATLLRDPAYRDAVGGVTADLRRKDGAVAAADLLLARVS